MSKFSVRNIGDVIILETILQIQLEKGSISGYDIFEDKYGNLQVNIKRKILGDIHVDTIKGKISL